MKIFMATTVLSLISTTCFAVEEYQCNREYFSNTPFLDKEAVKEVMPQDFRFLLDDENGIAITSVTGRDNPLKYNGKTASLPINSGILGHRLKLDVRKLANKNEVTWGPVHSDTNYVRSKTARYSCKKI